MLKKLPSLFAALLCAAPAFAETAARQALADAAADPQAAVSSLDGSAISPSPVIEVPRGGSARSLAASGLKPAASHRFSADIGFVPYVCGGAAECFAGVAAAPVISIPYQIYGASRWLPKTRGVVSGALMKTAAVVVGLVVGVVAIPFTMGAFFIGAIDAIEALF